MAWPRILPFHLKFADSRVLAQQIDARWVASGLRARVLLPLGIALVLLVLAIGSLIVNARLQASQKDAARTATAVDTMLRETTATEVQAMQTAIELMMADERLEAAFRARDRQALQALSAPILARLLSRRNVSQFYYILPDHSTLLRVHDPRVFGDRIDRASLRQAERTGQPAWASEPGPLSSLTVRVVHPWRIDGQLAGYLELGVPFQHLAEEIQHAYGVDLLVAIDKSRFNAAQWEAVQKVSPRSVAWDEFPGVVLPTRTTEDIPAGVRDYLSVPDRRQSPRSSFETDWGERVARVFALPFKLDGERVGELIVLQDVSEGVRERRLAVGQIALPLAGIGGALMLLFYVLLGRVQEDIAARTERLEEAGQQLAAEQHERLLAEQALGIQQERNELLEGRARMVEELAAANQTAQQALRDNEEVTARLVETQARLVNAARDAGRAEIATNVLHNVGNVLNSVNISAGVIGGTLRHSRLPNLARALALLGEHKEDLGYLSRDDKGRLLPGYLEAVAETLAGEQQAMGQELERLSSSIEHIKDIVSTQQSHAAAARIIEPVEPAALAEEALRMQGSALARHHVTVLRQFAPLPALPLDRARILQVLVNLISNAKFAMGDLASGELTLRVEMAGEARLRFAVQDQGEGIPPDNLTRMFAHGFTTRKGGHGFGLHGSALAAHEMGGTLTAASDGPGRGATFTLEVPVMQVPPAS